MPVKTGGTELQGLKQRREFLAAAKARKAVSAGIILQDRDRRDGDAAIRVGFTASKKVGNAVFRNRAKRRMRALARDIVSAKGEPGHDYVLIARRDATVSMRYEDLQSGLIEALRRVRR